VIDATPTHVDAVAIHGGGGERREREIPAVLLLGNHADFLVTMGGPLPSGDPDITYAGATARRLREIGLYDDDRMVTLASGASTEGELRALRGEAERRGWRSLALSTVSWHTRRVDVTAAWVFAGSGIDVSVVAIPVGGDLDLDEWWKSAWGRRVIAGEWAKLLFFALSR
jgi:hypothetical protein